MVCPDLRGYGGSGKPPGDPGHERYAKRTMAADVKALMAALGHDRFAVGAGVDVAHDAADRDQGRRITAPVLLLWGQPAGMELPFDPLARWRRWAGSVDGHALPCGHFLAEERPGDVVDALQRFLS